MGREIQCRSCGSRFQGRYCNHCGEKVLTEDDLKLKHLAAELIGALTFADSKFWKTLKSVALKPGRFSRDYVDGRRRPYMTPLAVFFLANLIYFLLPLMNTFYSTLQMQVSSGNFIHGPLAAQMVEERLEERQVSFEQYAVEYESKTKELSKLLLVLMAAMISLPLWWLHGIRERRYLINVVLSLELMTFVILFAVQAQGVLLLTLHLVGASAIATEEVISSVALLLLLCFLIGAERRFYGLEGPKAWIRAVLGVLVFVAVMFLYRAMLFFVTFWMT